MIFFKWWWEGVWCSHYVAQAGPGTHGGCWHCRRAPVHCPTRLWNLLILVCTCEEKEKQNEIDFLLPSLCSFFLPSGLPPSLPYPFIPEKQCGGGRRESGRMGESERGGERRWYRECIWGSLQAQCIIIGLILFGSMLSQPPTLEGISGHLSPLAQINICKMQSKVTTV